MVSFRNRLPLWIYKAILKAKAVKRTLVRHSTKDWSVQNVIERGDNIDYSYSCGVGTKNRDVPSSAPHTKPFCRSTQKRLIILDCPWALGKGNPPPILTMWPPHVRHIRKFMCFAHGPLRLICDARPGFDQHAWCMHYSKTCDLGYPP